ncbi:MAG: potassium-transporting ATPase subunit KdpC [Candidatus Omnitrophica bacterium]|nr:potassium-transporting ATPase subunit KdpC [Candidatus Omnitrophota bacterium]
MFREQIRPAIMIFIVLTVITGGVYPLIVTGMAQVFFHKQANGSLICPGGGQCVGSTLIGQNFDDPKYFWGRLSATTPAYNASASSGSNLGPSNPALAASVKARILVLKAVDPGNQALVPVDLVTASASGLDPHLSLAGVNYQLARVAGLRKLPEAAVRQVVGRNMSGRFLGLLGEPVVNVLKVNLALDGLKPASQP